LKTYLETNLVIARVSENQRKAIIEKTTALFAGSVKTPQLIDTTVFWMMRTLNASLQLQRGQSMVINLLIGHHLRNYRS